jgi:hypothetical protein
LLDQPNAFHGFDGAADVVFVTGGAGEDQRIEDDIFRRKTVFCGEQFVGTLGNS